MAWEGKPEKGAVPAWYSSVLSELLTAHTMSRAKMYKKSGRQCERGVKKKETTEDTYGICSLKRLFGLCLLETARL